jgi:cytochrome P450
VALVAGLRERYGDFVHIRLGAMRLFIVGDLDVVKHVLVDNHRNYSKGPAYELLAKALGEGLVTSDGELWRRHRQIIQPTMHRDHMRDFVGAMTRTTEEDVRRLEPIAASGGEVDVSAMTMELAIRIVARALLGADIAGREAVINRAMSVVFDHVERLSMGGLRVLEMLPGGRLLASLRRRLPGPPTRRHRAFVRAVASIDRVIHDVIEERRRQGPPPDADDLVATLLRARDADGRALGAGEIRDEIITMFIAGHETTATALAWCLHLLATHPAEQRAVAEESAAVLGDRVPEAADLTRLTRARLAFTEAMRLFPPVWRISRVARSADRIGRWDIPAGSIIVIYPYLVHRNPSLWDSPGRFDPARFSPERSAGRDRLAYIPFGVGQRMCIGAAFATAEAQVVLSMLTRAMHFAPAGPEPVLAPRIALRPRDGIRVRVRPSQILEAGAR